MKKIFAIIAISILFISCDDDKTTQNNPFIPRTSFTYDINLELPQFNRLKFPSNGILITDFGVGSNGIIVFNNGSGYLAYDANCPNQYLSECSRMTISGIIAKCPCDEKEYDLFTGTSVGAQHAMLSYRVEVSGSNIRIYN